LPVANISHMKIFHILPVLFFVSRMKISPGPVNKIPNIGKKKPIATQIRYSWMIADMMKADRRADNLLNLQNSTCEQATDQHVF
jgi:hypothetical protein